MGYRSGSVAISRDMGPLSVNRLPHLKPSGSAFSKPSTAVGQHGGQKLNTLPPESYTYYFIPEYSM